MSRANSLTFRRYIDQRALDIAARVYRPPISAGRDDRWTHRSIRRHHIATGSGSNRHGPDF